MYKSHFWEKNKNKNNQGERLFSSSMLLSVANTDLHTYSAL